MLKCLIDNPNEKTAEEVINGIDTDPAYEPVDGVRPVYIDYDADRDITMKFKDRINLPEVEIDIINYYLNKKSTKYKGESKRCPKCGKALALVGNDGHFCKFCGTHLKYPVNVTFGEAIKKLRLENGYGQTELGKIMKNSASYVCNLEKGNRMPTVEDCIKLSHIFKCSVNELFGQDAPREKIEALTNPDMMTYQEGFPTKDHKSPVKQEDIGGYVEDEEYIYKCPCCGKEVDLTPMESLSLGLPSYEVMQMRSHGNDGSFCKYCGQGLTRPVKIDEEKAFNAYSFWIKHAAKKCSL